MWKGVLLLMFLTVWHASAQCLYPPCPVEEADQCPRLDCTVESLDAGDSKIELHVNWTCCNAKNKNFTVTYEPRESCECTQARQEFWTTDCETVLESRCLSTEYDIVITHVPSKTSRHEIYKTLPPGVRTLTAVPLKGHMVRLSWNSSRYHGNWSFIIRWIGPDQLTRQKTTELQSLTLGPLDPDSNYTFEVESCDCKHHCSDYQSTWAISWSGGPDAPIEVHAGKITSDEILVRWKRPLHRKHPTRRKALVAGYILVIRTNITSILEEEVEILLPKTAQKYRFDDLVPSTNYTITICAFKMDGETRLDGYKATLFTRTADETSLTKSLEKFKGELLSDLKSVLKEGLCK